MKSVSDLKRQAQNHVFLANAVVCSELKIFSCSWIMHSRSAVYAGEWRGDCRFASGFVGAGVGEAARLANLHDLQLSNFRRECDLTDGPEPRGRVSDGIS